MPLRRVGVAMRKSFTAGAVWFLVSSALIAGSPAQAQLEVNPVNVEVAPGQLAASFKVTNRDSRPIAFQIRPFAWQLDAQGEDQLSATSKLMSSPPIATVPPGASQVVRLVLVQPPQGREGTYRILLDELPSPGEGGMVHVLLRLSIPVFAEPQSRVAPHLQWRVANEGGQYWLVVSNDGTKHLTLSNLQVFGPDGRPLQLKMGAPPHILAGATRRWQIETDRSLPGSSIRVMANRGTVNEQIALPAGP